MSVIPDFMNEPATRYELRMLFEILSNLDNIYIPEENYRKQIGISRTQFYYLRKEGKFDKGFHPATRGCRKRLIHRFFNMHSGRIEMPGLNYTEPIVTMRKPRKSSDKKVQKLNSGEIGTTEIPNITIEDLVRATYEPSNPNILLPTGTGTNIFQRQIEMWRNSTLADWHKVAFML
jgi:hypothetical protein